MTTIRGRIPSLLADLMDRGVSITFCKRPKDDFPSMFWHYREHGPTAPVGHAYLHEWQSGVYGANALAMEEILVGIFVDLPRPKAKG